MTAPDPIYDVSINGRGTGFNLNLEAAEAHAKAQGGTVMVSHDGGQTWTPQGEDT